MDDLYALEEWASGLLARLTPAAQRKAAGDIGRELRRSQKARIAAQANPDGTPYVSRKPRNLRARAGRIKRKAMFAKLRTARFLKVHIDGEGVALGFMGRTARVARIHQEGQESVIAQGGVRYRYPARVLLGFTDAERDMIRDKLLAHAAG